MSNNETLAINSCNGQGANHEIASPSSTSEHVKPAGETHSPRLNWRMLTSTGEGEMARNRVVISLLILGYFLIESGLNGRVLTTPILTISTFAAFSFALAAHVLLSPSPNPMRRLVAMSADIGTLSFGLYIGGEVTACTWPVYLWVIYGNGFRFGQKYLAISTAIATACFTTIIMITPFWLTFHNLSYGLLIGLIILPLYARKLINDLSIARLRAEEANKTKSHFLASVSHELRTPLNAIVGLSDCLTSTHLDPEQGEMLSTINRSGRTLSHLIENILDFSRLESGAMPCNIKQVNLPSLVADICALASTQAVGKNVAFNVHLAPEVPVEISTDGLKLTQILTNFASNAIKFTDEGHVTLAISTKPIDKNTVRLRFEMHDTGIGISQDAKDKIFERFTQANDKIVDRYGGTGLGLAIVKQTASLIGGTVGVESTRGQGSTFWCEIPVAATASNADENDPARSMKLAFFVGDATTKIIEQTTSNFPSFDILKNYDELLSACDGADHNGIQTIIFTDGETHDVVVDWLAERGDQLARVVRLTNTDEDAQEAKVIRQTSIGQIPVAALDHQLHSLTRWIEDVLNEKYKKRAKIQTRSTPASILIAEDNPANQLVIRKIMSNAGHKFTIVDDGDGVMAALSKNNYDIILLDLNMPVMNGFETIKFVRFSTHDTHVPVIAVTADATVETAERCRNASFDDIVTKPYQAQTLLNMIDQHTSDQTQSAASGQQVEEQVTPKIAEPRAQRERSHEQPDVLDLNQLEEIKAMGEAAFFENVAHTFLSECQKKLKDLDACSRNNHQIEVSRIAHGLKSSALNIGAKCVVTICDELEGKAESADAEWTEKTVNDLRVAVDECCVALLNQVDLHTEMHQPKVAVSYH